MRNSIHFGRSRKRLFENLRIIMGILVIVLAVLTFFLYQKNRLMFALCFFAAAAMHFFEGCVKMIPGEQHRRELPAAIFWFVCALIFVVLGVFAGVVRF